MDSDNELSAGSVRLGSTTGGDVEVPHGDSPAKESSVVSSRDAVTRKIRNPLLKSEETTPVVQVQVSLASSEPPPRTAAELVPPIDVSENIHPFPPVAQGKQDDKSSGGSTKARHKGLAIVVAVVVAGTAVDIFLWRTSSARHAKTAPLAGAIATSTAFSNAVDLPGTASSTSTVPLVEPLPDRSHSEVSGKTAVVDLVPEDADPKIGARSERPSARPAELARPAQAALKPKKDVRGKSTPKGGDDFGMDLRTTTGRRPTTTIDERDPYSP